MIQSMAPYQYHNHWYVMNSGMNSEYIVDEYAVNRCTFLFFRNFQVEQLQFKALF